MTRKALLRRLEGLSEEQFDRVAPFLKADLESVDALAKLHGEIEAARKSAKARPLLDASALYPKVRDALAG